jgi:thiosulfate/3-mercaptopyruvate sulfurtransferase
MAPPAEKFISRMRAMGVGDGHQVVVYDGAGMFSAARVWWLFRLMGKPTSPCSTADFPNGRPRAPVDDMPP